jgi:hypothetical protein
VLRATCVSVLRPNTYLTCCGDIYVLLPLRPCCVRLGRVQRCCAITSGCLGLSCGGVRGPWFPNTLPMVTQVQVRKDDYSVPSVRIPPTCQLPLRLQTANAAHDLGLVSFCCCFHSCTLGCPTVGGGCSRCSIRHRPGTRGILAECAPALPRVAGSFRPVNKCSKLGVKMRIATPACCLPFGARHRNKGSTAAAQ